MIKSLHNPKFSTFDRASLSQLAPYFDISYNNASADERIQWFENLLTLAKHDLSIAHCVHHNHYAKSTIEMAHAQGKVLVDNLDYTKTIGCLSNVKSVDTMNLYQGQIQGTKHWISMLDRSDYAVFYVSVLNNPEKKIEALIALNLNTVSYKIEQTTATLGMEIARPASMTLAPVCISDNNILGYRVYGQGEQIHPHLNNFANYCFITNFLGINIGLYHELDHYVQTHNLNKDLEFKKIGLEISGLYMLWKDNLESINQQNMDDKFWHRRNTQYVMGKNALIKLINLILQIGDSRWMTLDASTQKFRDALTFCSHMRPLNNNLSEQFFVNF